MTDQERQASGDAANGQRSLRPPRIERLTDLSRHSAVYVIGDSIVHGARFHLWQRHPDWTINAESGRNVRQLPGLVAELLEANREPEGVVLALGTNADPDWTREALAAVVDSLPSKTSVWLVTTYRDPELWGPERCFRHQAQHQQRYSQWMNQVAKARDNVGLIRWRKHAARAPRLMHDGVHPNRRGKRRLTRLISTAVLDAEQPGTPT